MTRDDIIRMAREVETVMTGHDFPHSEEFIEWCERFAALVVAAEREACAQVCEQKSMVKGGEVFATRIRARGAA